MHDAGVLRGEVKPQKPIDPLLNGVTLTENDVRGFLAGIGSRAECPECGVNQWNIAGLVSGPEGHIPSMVITDAFGRMAGGSMPLILLVCGNCGNVKSFSRLGVIHWLSAKPAKDV